MSKPSASNKFMPAGWVVPGCTVALAALAAIGIVGSANLRGHKAVATTRPVAAAPVQAPALSARGRVQANMGKLPLGFEANQGQTDPQVKYMARGNGYTVFLTANDTVFALQASSGASITGAASKHGFGTRGLHQERPEKKNVSAAIHMRVVGGNARAQIAAGSQLPGVSNYYIGGDRSKWQAGVRQYASVGYRDVYPGVNMAFHGEQRQLEFDFIVAAGANAAPISLGFSGAHKIATDASGNLLLSSVAGDVVVLHKPVAYQEKDGQRQNVAAEFVQEGNKQVGFTLGSYDHTRALVIDPALSYSTYLGGSGEDEAFAIAVDASGNVYVAGQTASINFPAHAGTFSTVGGFDAFVTKLNASGSSLVFTTLIGGGGDDAALGIAVSSTAAYIGGITASSTITFPSTVTLGPGGGQDAFAARLNSTTGAAVYVTRIGGTGSDSGNAIAVDSTGNAYLVGETDSANYPTTTSPIQGQNSGTDDAFISKINPAGTALVYSTYLGGSQGDLATGIALDGSSNAYVAGITGSSNFPTTTGAFQTVQKGTFDNGFVTEIKADGSATIYSTYLGGSAGNDPFGIAVDSAGEAYVTGSTNSTDFPTVNPAQTSNAGGLDVFVTKFNSSGSALLFSTYYGGTLDETGTGIALDSFGDAYVTGRTASSTYPVSGTPFQGAISGSSDAFVTELSNTGFVVYSSFLGGTGNENSIAGVTTNGALGAVAVDSSSNAYLAGDTDSTQSFPLASPLACCGAFAGGLADGFVAKVGAAPADFSVAVAPTSASVNAGQSTSAITVTVSSVNSSFGQAVALSCTGLPTGAGCNFTSASLTPTSSAATTSLTITTTGATAAMNGSSKIFYAM
ncbi:MAG TPA: SBBP repeat-containing protein, partial [Candidatus Acidoferrum sp.]|nr:SBBP repeat-containing protein [Candidatus Acidoferrum sp.]